MSNPKSDRLSTSVATAKSATETLLAELKTRARLRLNALSSADPVLVEHAQWICKKRCWPLPNDWKLHHTLSIVATEIGFRDWEHARRVLSGLAKPGEDLGGFWYNHACERLLNHWFARYDEAKACQKLSNDRWLFPYGRQFVVGDVNFIKTLMLDPNSNLWSQVDRDLSACYGSAIWQEFCVARMTVTRGLPPPISGRY